jgi:hypothetical protein
MSLNASHCFRPPSWFGRTRVGADTWLDEVPVEEGTEDYEDAILKWGKYRAYVPSLATLTWRIAQISRAYVQRAGRIRTRHLR